MDDADIPFMFGFSWVGISLHALVSDGDGRCKVASDCAVAQKEDKDGDLAVVAAMADKGTDSGVTNDNGDDVVGIVLFTLMAESLL